MTKTLGGLLVTVLLVCCNLSETHGQDEALLKRLRAFPWPAYQRDIGFRQNGLAVYLTLPDDEALLDDLPKLPKSRPLRVALGGKVTDVELSRLRTVTNLESLFLNDATITADGLGQLQQLPLNELTLNNVEIRGEAIKQLAALPQLRHLDLADVTMEEADVSHFADMVNLAHLSMDFAISDEQMVHLAALGNLQELTLAKSPISDKGFQHLSRLTGLRALLILDSKITEDGFQHLAELRHFTMLIVPGVKVGEDGLRRLSRLPNLRHFRAEVDEELLQQHLPRVAREWLSGHLARETALEFFNDPLVDVAEFVSDMHDIRLEFDEDAVKQKRVQPLVPITFEVRGIPLGSALNLMLRPLDLEYVVLADRILITSPTDAATRLETEVYDLDSFVAPDNQAAVAELVATMRQVVKPASTGDGGAARGSLQIDGATLTISHSQATHESIRAFLTGLGPYGGRTQTNERIRRELSLPTQVECKATPLSDVVRKLSRGVPILFDPVAIKAGELDVHAPVTALAKGVPLGKLLTDVLEPLKLTWVIRDETLQVTSHVQANKNIELRVYHVGDLITDAQTSDRLAAQIRDDLKFDLHDDWRCSQCLNRIVVRAPFQTHARVERVIEQLRELQDVPLP